MGRIFGTDGARGVANIELDCSLAFKLGQAAVRFMGPSIVVGKDTRLSGDMLEAAVSAGVMSLGGTVLSVGIVPTPAVALLTRKLYGDGGIVISASHNPPKYNGIKFFDRQGFKLPDEVEDEIEAFLGGDEELSLPDGSGVGIITPIEDAASIYIDETISVIQDQGVSFEGLRIALDTGHGAAGLTSPDALRRLGATVSVINEDFNGCDINVDCGSTHLEALKDFVLREGADFGIAHDGDADRVMFIDSEGHEMDGDVIECVCALDMKARGELPHDTVVSTVMCNLGFKRAMAQASIDLHQTQVGDRYVLQEMREGGYALGGEQSGHMIFLDHNSTGDGLLTACLFIAACVRNGWSSTTASTLMERFPQVLVNVEVQDKNAFDASTVLRDFIAAEQERLGDEGTVLVRKSGTEPVIRVMVEATTTDQAQAVADRLADRIRQEGL